MGEDGHFKVGRLDLSTLGATRTLAGSSKPPRYTPIRTYSRGPSVPAGSDSQSTSVHRFKSPPRHDIHQHRCDFR